MLVSREVIFTEDVENIFGKRPWVSRTDEILAAKEKSESSEDSENSESSENSEPSVTPPPFKGLAEE